MTVLVQYTDDARDLAIQEPRRGTADYELVFNSSDGLETTIPFDEVDIGRAALTFIRCSQHGQRVKTGSVEQYLDAWGGVGEWLREHAAPTEGRVA